MIKNYDIKSSFIRKRNENYNVIIEFIGKDGKLKQKSLTKVKDKKEAEKYLIDLKSSINNNNLIISNNITLIDRCYKYLEDNKEDLSVSTIYNYKNCIKNQILPYFKDTKLKDVTIRQVQLFVNDLYKKYAVNSCKSFYNSFRAIMSECYRLKEIPENPCDFIKLPSKPYESNTDVYDREEAKKIMKSIEGTVLELPILLMLTLGLRKGEMAGLRWEDVNFEEDTISVNQILIYIESKLIIKEPKTLKSKRTLHAPKELMTKLKKEKIRQNQLILQDALENKYNLVCLNSFSRPWIKTSLNRHYSKFCKKNNLKEIRLHDLRHTNATMMILSGTNIKTVSERLGHTDIKISLNRYSHVLEEMDKEASANISNILFK